MPIIISLIPRSSDHKSIEIDMRSWHITLCAIQENRIPTDFLIEIQACIKAFEIHSSDIKFENWGRNSCKISMNPDGETLKQKRKRLISLLKSLGLHVLVSRALDSNGDHILNISNDFRDCIEVLPSTIEFTLKIESK